MKKKSLLPMVAALMAMAMLSSCTTLANRRDLFGPSKPEGEFINKHNKLMYHPIKHHGVPN